MGKRRKVEPTVVFTFRDLPRLADRIQEMNLNSEDAREIGSVHGRLDELCRD
jgi:hypothetical protein